MKYSRIIPAAIVVFLILFTSCQDRKTYADYLKDESRAIERFIAQNNISVLERFPSNGQFGDNEFYKDAITGVYYHITSYGDTTQRVMLGEEVYIRFKGLSYFMSDDTTKFNNFDPNVSPFPQTLIFRGEVNQTTSGYYETPGWMVPVPIIGHKAVVKMIVPFEMGSSYDRSQYQATYYDHVEYRFESHY